MMWKFGLKVIVIDDEFAYADEFHPLRGSRKEKPKAHLTFPNIPYHLRRSLRFGVEQNDNEQTLRPADSIPFDQLTDCIVFLALINFSLNLFVLVIFVLVYEGPCHRAYRPYPQEGKKKELSRMTRSVALVAVWK